MKIIKYQKKKQGKYLIKLEDGTEIETYEDMYYDTLLMLYTTYGAIENVKCY